MQQILQNNLRDCNLPAKYIKYLVEVFKEDMPHNPDDVQDLIKDYVKNKNFVKPEEIEKKSKLIFQQIQPFLTK